MKSQDVFQVLREDIKAATKAFKENDFDYMNIFANRAMANVIMGPTIKYVLPGFFLKDVASTYRLLNLRKIKAFETAKSFGKDYLKSLSTLLPEFDERKAWEDYYGFNLKIRKFMMNEFEETAYSENLSFSDAALEWMIKYLLTNEQMLLDPNNNFLKGVINEIVRIYQVHGGSLKMNIAASLIEALDRCYEYLEVYKGSTENLFEKKAKQEIIPYLKRIADVILIPKSDKEMDFSAVDSILCELVKRWREYFIQYMERPRAVIPVEKAVRIPEEAKKKISESLTKALEAEAKLEK